jgi:hypothetical protein
MFCNNVDQSASMRQSATQQDRGLFVKGCLSAAVQDCGSSNFGLKRSICFFVFLFD